MKLYIVKNVLVDYSSGMIVLAAESPTAALALIRAVFTTDAAIKNPNFDMENISEGPEVLVDAPYIIDFVYGGA